MTRKKTTTAPTAALTEKEVYDVVAFAHAMSGMYGNTILTPDLINARMKDITMNPLAATESSLTSALNDPKNSEDQLRMFSENFEIQSQPYKRLLAYLGSMLSFDLTYTATNVKKDADYKKEGYKSDLERMFTFMDRFDYRDAFATIIKQMLRNETYFCIVREDAQKVILQELPSQYCKIDGRWDNGFLFSMNFYWFMQPGVDIRMYPPFFQKKYKEIFVDGQNGTTYNPAMPPMSRDGNWIYWVEIPAGLGWVFKMSPETAARVPYFSGLFLDLIQQSVMRNLQKNANMSAATRMIIGQVPMLKDAKASVADMIAIDPKTLGEFIALVKSALSEAIGFASAPLEQLQAVSWPSENEIYNSFLKTALASSGVNTNLIFSSDIKPNAIETRLSLNTDEQMMEALYPQFNKFMDFFINRLTKTFKFATEFEGTKFFTNRADRFDRAMALTGLGIVLPQKIAAAQGMRPQDMYRQMAEAKAMGFVENLTPIVPAAQMPAEGAGRPAKKDSTLSESGSQTRENADNVDRGGKI
jgi:hypothetical protein